MHKNLVIVESPAKAKTINKFLGDHFIVESCYGHIKDLPKKELGVDIENGFKPTYQIIPGKEKIIKKLKKLSKNAEQIYLSTDMDREGEAIAWHLSQELKGKKRVRITFNQITKEAIKKAIHNPGKIDIHKVEAQQGRRVLDRLVGYKISPILWEKLKRGLSAGRVQSVAVRIICDREKKIEEFIPQEYWTFSSKFILKGKRILEAKLTKIEGKKTEIINENEAEKVVQKLIKENFSVVKIEEKTREKSPEPPFTTSGLQQAGGYHLNFSVAKIMKLAQDLYEGQNIGDEERVGLITYMRTDSFHIAKEAESEARDYIGKEIGKEFLPKKKPRYRNKKSSQDAHEAIRPTSVWRTPEKIKKYLSNDHFKLYNLIWKRFIASQMEKAILKTVTMDIQGGKYLFQAEGKRIDFPGFTLIYKEKREKEKILPPLVEGTKIRLKEVILAQHFTQSPPHYTESSLVKTLEEKNIGRPSTYAPIISTIKAREYVKWDKGKLIPTLLAKVVNKLLMENFSAILDIKFTAKMEENLDAVEQDKKKWTNLIDEFYKYFEQDLKTAEKKMRNIKKEGIPIGEIKCKTCGKNMVLKFGRYGEFLACSDYPNCKNTEPLPRRVIMKCPYPDCDGEIVEKVSKKNGRLFYGCTKFPQCKFISSEEPIEIKCPHCGNPYLIKIKGKLKCPVCNEKFEDSIIKEKKVEGIVYKIVKKKTDGSKLDKKIYSIS